MMMFQRVAVVDFDNTLALYDEWRGPEHLGAPVPFARPALQELISWGWWINVHTTRGEDQSVLDGLVRHHFPSERMVVNSLAFNPAGTSKKPIAAVYFDDRDAHCVGAKPYNWHRAMHRVRRIYQPSPDTNVDDSQAWASLMNRARGHRMRNYARFLLERGLHGERHGVAQSYSHLLDEVEQK